MDGAQRVGQREVRLRKNRKTGTVLVGVRTPRGMQWISTGQTSYRDAKRVCDEARVQEAQMAACANLLMSDVISRLLTGKRCSCTDILEAWREEAGHGTAPGTRELYGIILNQWLVESKLERTAITGIRRGRLSEWVNHPGLSLNGRVMRRKVLVSFYKFAVAAGFCGNNPMPLVKVSRRGLEFGQMEPKETVPMTEAEFRVLMTGGKISRTWRQATALAYWLGLRLSDIAALEWASVQEDRIVVYVRKTGRRLELALDDPLLGGGELRGIIAEMMEDRLARPGPYCFPEFRETINDVRKRAKLSVQFGRVLARNGITGRRFHSLRHAAAMRLKDAGVEIEGISRVLGHSGTAATRIYTAHEGAGEKDARAGADSA